MFQSVLIEIKQIHMGWFDIDESCSIECASFHFPHLAIQSVYIVRK